LCPTRIKGKIMRNVLLILFALVCLNSSAQNTTEKEQPHYYYLQLHPFAWVGGKEWRGEICLDGYDPYIICDENNERMVFSGPMQIVNYLSKIGWEIVTFENVSGQFYYLFRKLLIKDEEARAGMNLLTSDEIKKTKKNN